MSTKDSSILVVDDEPSFLVLMEMMLRDEGFNVTTASNGKEALEIFTQKPYDLIVSDIRMPGLSGEALLEAAKKHDPNVEVVLVTAHTSLDEAARAVMNGAFDYLNKPFSFDELIEVVNRALKHRALIMAEQHAETKSAILQTDLIGRSRPMLDLFKIVGRAAPSDSTVLIVGASGTGKELLAKHIHKLSKRSKENFVAINCGALSETLLESELFGHTKGSFTGATADRPGLFKEADNGTIFLDEVTETTPGFQVKLLRVLQEGEVLPVGSSVPKKVNVRVIAATNQDLDKLVEEKKFRSDLVYRLRVITLTIPNLRERVEDIPLLASFFINKYADANQAAPRLTTEIIDILQTYDWPGNVRELENAMESAVVLSQSPVITVADLPERIRTRAESIPVSAPTNIAQEDFPIMPLAEMEYRYTQKVLTALGGNKSQTARVLGIDRKTLDRIINRHISEESTNRPIEKIK